MITLDLIRPGHVIGEAKRKNGGMAESVREDSARMDRDAKCLVKTANRTIVHQAHLAWQLNVMCSPLLLALCLLCSLGDLASTLVGLGNALNDTDGNGLTHVTAGN